jgi:hypothetical protein
LHELSQTHLDSIKITRGLGYRYIWIDSLCIIQDSPEDWRNQSTQMAAIYGDSTCNIVAKGPSSHSGCFVRRNPLMRRPCQLRQFGDQDQSHGIYAHPYSTATYNSYPMDYYSTNAPLLQRAWVQQERLLSPRILYFGDPDIHWECCTIQASESCHWVRQTTITALAKSFHSKPPLSPNSSLSMTGAKPITPVSSTNSGTMAWHYQRLRSGEIDIRKGQNVCLSRHCYRNPASHWPYVYGGPVEGASSPRHVVVQDGRPRAQ